MPKHCFLNVPEDITNKILSHPEFSCEKAYRGLYQKGDPQPTDFYPTFVDDKQRLIREKRMQCGLTASFIVSQHQTKQVKYYGVSLFCSLDEAKRVLWKNDSYKKDYPAFAVGTTNTERGYCVKDSAVHSSYYLHDYLNNNPYVDFVTIEEVDDDE